MPEVEAEPREIPQVTDELLAELEFRYADPRACRVCSAPLTVGDTKNWKRLKLQVKISFQNGLVLLPCQKNQL